MNIKLDSGQQTLINNIRDIKTANIIRCDALAGAGKTTAIRFGVEKYLEKHPKHKVSIITYNKELSLSMEKDLYALINPKFHKQITIGTIHSMLYQQVLRQTKPVTRYTVKRISEKEYWEDIREYFKFPSHKLKYGNKTLKILFKHFHRYYKNYQGTTYEDTLDYIFQYIDETGFITDDIYTTIAIKETKIECNLLIVDEFQDLSVSIFNYFRKDRNTKIPQVYLGDFNQSIYGYGDNYYSTVVYPSIFEYTKQSGLQKIQLTHSYRQSDSLVKFSMAVLGKYYKDYADVSGNKINVWKTQSLFNPKTDNVVHLIRYHKEKIDVYEKFKDRYIIYIIGQRLKGYGLKDSVAHSLKDAVKLGKVHKKPIMQVRTVHSAKGNEYRWVALSEELLELNDKHTYVAMTRAKLGLVYLPTSPGIYIHNLYKDIITPYVNNQNIFKDDNEIKLRKFLSKNMAV